MLSIMICTNWVCAGAFVDHERVSERTIIQHEEEILGLELNNKINVPCVCGGMESVMVFSTYGVEYHFGT